MATKRKTPAGQGEGAQPADKSKVSTRKSKPSSTRTQGRNHDRHSLLAAEPKPWSKPVDGAALLDELVDVLRRHLSLPESAAEAMALWVVHTHALDASDISPRLALLSPLPACGKTTALTLLSHLVARPLIASNMTPPVLFRAIEMARPTLLVDELDSFFDVRAEFAGIVNSGHSRGAAYVVRCVGDDHVPTRFETWAAAALARIGDLPEALQTRSLVITMRRARADEGVERLRREHHNDLAKLKRRAARWAKDHIQQLIGADPVMPERFEGRLSDNWRPLLAIADVVGGHWPEKARCAASHLSGEDEVSVDEQLLADMLSLFEEQDADRLTSQAICDALRKDADGFPLSPPRLAQTLKPFGVRPRVIRVGSSTPRGYLRSEVEDAASRYAPRRATDSGNPE